jgi:type III secretory pathway component EscS
VVKPVVVVVKADEVIPVVVAVVVPVVVPVVVTVTGLDEE